MSPVQKLAIDAMDTEGLRKQISVLATSKADNKNELIKYCELRLKGMDRSNAMVENTDMSDFGGH